MRLVAEQEEFDIGGWNINDIRCSDYIILPTDSEEKLRDILKAVTEASEVKGLTINVDKTK